MASVTENVCLKEGHRIQAIITADRVDPISKTVTHDYKVLCTFCGKSVEEVLKYKDTGASRARKRAKQNGGQADSNDGNGTVGGTQSGLQQQEHGAGTRPVPSNDGSATGQT